MVAICFGLDTGGARNTIVRSSGVGKGLIVMSAKVSIDDVPPTSFSLLVQIVQVRCTCILELHEASCHTCHSLGPMAALRPMSIH